MFGDLVVATITDGEGRKRIARLRGKFANFETVMRGPLLAYLQQQARRQFETEGAYFGNPWAARAKSTLERYAELGIGDKGILRVSDRLFNSYVEYPSADSRLEMTPHSMRLTSLVPWSAAHQTGAPSRHMPAREVFPESMPEAFMTGLKKIITGYIIEVGFT